MILKQSDNSRRNYLSFLFSKIQRRSGYRCCSILLQPKDHHGEERREGRIEEKTGEGFRYIRTILLTALNIQHNIHLNPDTTLIMTQSRNCRVRMMTFGHIADCFHINRHTQLYPSLSKRQINKLTLQSQPRFIFAMHAHLFFPIPSL